jgi:hypothetical protein
MFAPAAALAVSSAQRQVLESLARAGTTPQLLAQKCRVILLASEAVPNNAIAQQTGLSRPTEVATRSAFALGGLEAIRERQKSQTLPASPDNGIGAEDSRHNLKDAASVCDPLERANSSSASRGNPHGSAWSLAALRGAAPPGREVQTIQ